MTNRTRITALPAVAVIALSGCYEYEEPPPTNQAPAAAPAANSTTPGRSSGEADARPSHAGARQAARNTVDDLNERQRELEKALEDED